MWYILLVMVDWYKSCCLLCLQYWIVHVCTNQYCVVYCVFVVLCHACLMVSAYSLMIINELVCCMVYCCICWYLSGRCHIANSDEATECDTAVASTVSGAYGKWMSFIYKYCCIVYCIIVLCNRIYWIVSCNRIYCIVSWNRIY